MKQIKTNYVISLLSFILLALSSCSSPEKPPVVSMPVAQNSEISHGSLSESTGVSNLDTAEEQVLVNEMVISALKGGQLTATYSLFGGQNAVECSGNIYFHDGRALQTIDRQTGNIRRPCRDPLCKHTDCINALDVRSIISDGKNIYMKGRVENTSVFSVTGGSRWTEFVGVYDPKKDTFHMLDSWAGESGSSSSALRLDDGYLYYLRRHSDTTNSLYRILISGGKAERITAKEEFVIDFCVAEGKIHYRDSTFTHKSVPINNSDKSDIKIEEENICVLYSDEDGFFTISSLPINKDQYVVMIDGIPLPDPVYAPAAVMKSGHELWYTMSDNVSIPYTDESGHEKTTISPNGTKLYRYNLLTGERNAYNITSSYGVAPNAFYGMIGDWLFLNVCNPDRLIVQAFFNTYDTSQYTVLYDE